MPGIKQRRELAAAAIEQQGGGGGGDHSQLGEYLLSQYFWGVLSAPAVQTLAGKATADGLNQPLLVKLASIGSNGQHLQNMHRDILRIAGATSLATSWSAVSVLLKVPNNPVEHSRLDTKIILPHVFFSKLWEEKRTSFYQGLLGQDDGSLVKAFWKAMADTPMFAAKHAAWASKGHNLDKVIPLAVHGDGVTYQNVGRTNSKTLEVLSWTSLLSQECTIKTTFIICMIPKHLNKDSGISPTWQTLWRQLVWSFNALFEGLWPAKDWRGCDWPAGSPEAAKANSPLADGWAGIIYLVRGDLEWMTSHHKLGNHRTNTPCALCPCNSDDSMPWTDCSFAARWRKSIWTHTSFKENFPRPHMSFNDTFLVGATIFNFVPDYMHCKHLGTDQYLLASVILYMCRVVMEGSEAENLAMLVKEIKKQYGSGIVNEEKTPSHYQSLTHTCEEVSSLEGCWPLKFLAFRGASPQSSKL